MRGVRFESVFSRISGMASFSFAGLLAKVIPREAEAIVITRAVNFSKHRYPKAQLPWITSYKEIY